MIGLSGIRFDAQGDFSNTLKFLKKATSNNVNRVLSAGGPQGVSALRAATPVRTGKTAAAWNYRMSSSGSGIEILWYNSNQNRGFDVAKELQYGHGTGTGGYVPGRDYINPAMKLVFNSIDNQIERWLNS